MTRVVVVGGGIAGLATAHALRAQAPSALDRAAAAQEKARPRQQSHQTGRATALGGSRDQRRFFTL